MRMRSTFPLALLALALGGCFPPAGSGPSATATDGGVNLDGGGKHWQGGALPSGVQEYGMELFTNIPDAFIADHVGYFLSSAVGTGFRLVTKGTASGKPTATHFYGSIWTTVRFTSVTPGCGGACPLNPGDFVSDIIEVQGGERVDFDLYNAGDALDGFDFLTNGTPLYIDLFVDGKRQPGEVWFPDVAANGAPGNPASLPAELLGT